MMTNILQPVELAVKGPGMFVVMSMCRQRVGIRKEVRMWYAVASFAAVPVFVFLMWGMIPFLEFLGKRSVSERLRKGHEDGSIPLPGQWQRTKPR